MSSDIQMLVSFWVILIISYTLERILVLILLVIVRIFQSWWRNDWFILNLIDQIISALFIQTISIISGGWV